MIEEEKRHEEVMKELKGISWMVCGVAIQIAMAFIFILLNFPK